MWKGNKGPCTCYYCEAGKPHPVNTYHVMSGKRGHLQVAESLDPKDVVWTKVCILCTHETLDKEPRP